LDIQWVPLFEDWEGGIKRILEVIQPIPLEVQHSISALHLPDKNMWRDAATNLGKIGHSSAAPALAPLINDNDKDISIAAAISLGKIGGPIAIQSLIAALKVENKNFSSIVVGALAKIGEPAVPELVKALSGDKNASYNAVEALKKIGDGAAMTLGKAMLSEKENSVRRLIVEILSHIIRENEEVLDRCEMSLCALKKALD
jgi:HEAT repeat protein